MFADLDAAREGLLSQLADFMSLVEDGLLLGVRRGDQVLGVVRVPKKLVALQTGKVFGFGDEQLTRIFRIESASGNCAAERRL